MLTSILNAKITGFLIQPVGFCRILFYAIALLIERAEQCAAASILEITGIFIIVPSLAVVGQGRHGPILTLFIQKPQAAAAVGVIEIASLLEKYPCIQITPPEPFALSIEAALLEAPFSAPETTGFFKRLSGLLVRFFPK
jgi:hypothetical protein